MIKQAFAKNYMPSGGGGNYKYYKINDPEILELVGATKMPLIDAIVDGKLYSVVMLEENSFNHISAIRMDNNYHYSVNTLPGDPDFYISVTGDLIKMIKSTAELDPDQDSTDEILSMFQEISKGEYEAMIKK